MIREDLNLGHVINVLSDLPDDETEQARLFGYDQSVDSAIVNTFLTPGRKWGYHDGRGRTLLIGGFIPLHGGVYRSWFLATRHAWKWHWRELSAEAVDRKAFMFEAGAHRIETVCLASRKLAHRWYKTVGSTLESTLTAFCIDGSDACMFVDIRRKH